MELQRRTSPALALALALAFGACADNPTTPPGPVATPQAHSYITFAPDAPEAEYVALCKVGPPGTYDFHAEVTGGITGTRTAPTRGPYGTGGPILFGDSDVDGKADYQIVVHADDFIAWGGNTVQGACLVDAADVHMDVAEGGGPDVTITIWETGMPSGMEFVKTDLYTSTGSPTHNPPDYAVSSQLGLGNPVDVLAGGNKGANVIFYDQYIAARGLTIEKTADAARVPAGSNIGFKIKVTSTGPGTALNVKLDDPLPIRPGIAWSADHAACSITGNVLSCNFGDMAMGATATVHLTSPTTALSCGAYDNTAAVSADGVPAVTSSANLTVECPSNASLSGCVYVDLNGDGTKDIGLGLASSWGIFVINGGDLIMNSSHITGSVALGPGATGSSLQKTDISGTFTYDPTSTWDHSNLTKDFLVKGGVVSANLAAAQAAANTASQTYAAMAPTQTFGNVTNSLTITGNGGVNVIAMTSLSYNSRTLTLTGTASDIFIINVAGGWTFADSKILLGGGVTASHVVFNFPTAGSTIDMYKATNVLNGTFLAPYRSVIYHNPAVFNGQLIAKNVAVHSDAKLTSVPNNVTEQCLAGVTVTLTNTVTASVLSTVTGYTFGGLPADTYALSLTALPAGYSYFTANVGTIGGSPVGSVVNPNAITNIVLPMSASGVNYDFAVKKN